VIARINLSQRENIGGTLWVTLTVDAPKYSSYTINGIVVLIIGSLILFKGGTLFRINPVLIAVVAVVIAAFLVFVIAKVVGAHRRQQQF
jgi:membrane-bound ClpP family serine protease